MSEAVCFRGHEAVIGEAHLDEIAFLREVYCVKLTVSQLHTIEIEGDRLVGAKISILFEQVSNFSISGTIAIGVAELAEVAPATEHWREGATEPTWIWRMTVDTATVEIRARTARLEILKKNITRGRHGGTLPKRR